MKKRIIALAAVLCMLQSPALADLKRGSSGEDVEQMQQQLIYVGALDDTADGKFGKKTEQAVKDMQAYFGQKKTGKAGEKFLDELSILWYTLNDEEISSMEMSEEEMEEQGLYCCPTEAETEFCPRHEFLHYMDGLLNVNGRKPPERVRCRIYQRIVLLGYREILAMYDAWEERLDDSEKHIAGEQKENFEEGFENVFGNIENYELDKPWLVKLQTWQDMRAWVMLTLVNECFDLYGMEANQ